MSSTFCVIPWIFQAVRNNGDIRVCCQANVTEGKGIVRHEISNKPFNAATDSLNDARNAPLMKTIRKNMIAGVWNKECGRCKEEEEAGLNSRRLYEHRTWNIKLDHLAQYTSEDGSIDTTEIPAIYYDLRFGNLCNLACRMCGPTDSHTWYEQWSKYSGKNEFNDTHGVVYLQRNSNGRLSTTDYDWHNSELFWEQIEGAIENIEHVYMAGGEPLLIDRHYKFLNMCITRNRAKSIVLEYNTNGTTLPAKIIDLWKEFKQVRIGVSVDGIGAVAEYQRWPSNWDQLYKNLLKLNNLAKESGNIYVWLAVTVTAYNVWHLPKMIEWKLFSSGLTHINISTNKPIISHHIAHQPISTNIRILSAQLKAQLRSEYDESLKMLEKSGVNDAILLSAKHIYDSITKYADAVDLSESFPEFIKYTKFLDTERGQDISKIVPQYANYFKD